MNELYPFAFEENYHPAIWGGEHWLVCGHPSAPGVVANGPLKGKTLLELAKEHGRKLLGTKSPKSDAFPLLVKIIDAHSRLSVQVHPNERTAPVTGGEPKTEMWYILAHEEGGAIYAGLNEGTVATDVENAVRTQKFEKVCVKHAVKNGECYFIPGGLVHAIGDGVTIFEVQQSSNTTYRLYDWGRVDKNGKPRQLHIEESLKSIDYDLPAPLPRSEVECAFFNFSVRHLEGTVSFEANAETFRIVYIVKGEAALSYEGGSMALKEGSCVLVPANCAVSLDGDAHFVTATL